jgi:hypothetical protein
VDVDNVNHAFVYNIVTGVYTSVLNPAGNDGGPVTGIDGNTVVGYFADPNHDYYYSGFTYNLATGAYTTLREPLASGNTFAEGVSGGTVVGYYIDTQGDTHGFVAAIPVPVLNLAQVGSNLVFTASNGLPGASCFILDTANLGLPRNQWPELSSNVFNTNGVFTYTNAVVPGMSPTYYALRMVE